MPAKAALPLVIPVTLRYCHLVVCVPKVLHGRSWRAETAVQEIFVVCMNSLDLDLGEGRSPLGIEVLG